MSVTVSFLGSAGVGSPLYVSSANPLPVTGTFTPGGTQDVNLSQVAGVATKTGNGTASGAQRVTLASDGTGVLAGVTTVTTVSAVTAITNALPAGSAVIGKVGIDQTTPGTTNLTYVKNVSAVGYETVAASQTAQALGGSGATGDYLVRLMIFPATTSPGNVILLDNATTIATYPGSSGYDAGLVPFSIEIGANSASGAWKVTTGANVSVVAIGNFT